MSERPRVLFVSPCSISGYAGNISRFRQTIALLSRDHEVEFLSLTEPSARHADKLLTWGAVPCCLPPMLQTVLRFVYKAVYVSNRILVERGLLAAYAFGTFDVIGRILLKSFSRRLGYDMVFTNYVWTARLWGELAKNTVIDLHDIHANRHERLGAKVWVSLKPDDEFRRIEEADVCLAIAWGEFQKLRELHGEGRIRFLPYWPGEPLPLAAFRQPVAVFLASCNQVNTTALDNLRLSGVVEVLMDLGVHIHVCGAICDSNEARLLKLAFPQVVQLLGIVDDLNSVLNTATLGINMASPSTGLKIKTVEYLHAGLRVIATAHGSDPWLERTCPGSIHLLPEGPLNGVDQERLRAWLGTTLANPTVVPVNVPGQETQRYWSQALPLQNGASRSREVV